MVMYLILNLYQKLKKKPDLKTIAFLIFGIILYIQDNSGVLPTMLPLIIH
jgi:hypothetical protein